MGQPCDQLLTITHTNIGFSIRNRGRGGWNSKPERPIMRGPPNSKTGHRLTCYLSPVIFVGGVKKVQVQDFKAFRWLG